MSEQNYWQNFYKGFDLNGASSFALFANKYFQTKGLFGAKLLDLGCGNGRDSYYFINTSFVVTGVDFASKLKSNQDFTFISSDINNLVKDYVCNYDIVYSRFFLHSIPNESIVSVLKWTPRYFIAEFRAEDDVPILYTNHYRNLISGSWILKQMLDNNYEILYFQKDHNLAVYKNENPSIIRLIGRKND